MINKKHAFTLAEALIILLIVSLIAAALIPVLTRRHREVALHGKWICTVNDRGKYMVKTIYNGVDKGFKQLSTQSCTFSPPANAYNFTVKAVGGGGGGAGGMQGTEDIIYDSSRDGRDFAQSLKRAGTYLMVAIGGGGSGGGNDCGEARRHMPSLRFDNSIAGVPDKYGNSYGFEDRALKSFDYTILYKNGTDEVFKYIHNADNYKSRNLCFAESDTSTQKWSFMETSSGEEKINTSVCWNYPAHGGYKGASTHITKTLPAGQSVYAHLGKGGKPGAGGSDYIYTYTTGSAQYTRVDLGADGGSGGQTIIDYGTGTPLIANGGGAGHSRQLVYLTYDVYVNYCPYQKKITQEPYNTNCTSYTSSSSCTSAYKCYQTTKQIDVPDPDWTAPADDPDAVHPTVKKTVFDKCHSETYPKDNFGVYDESKCVKVKRENYFQNSVPACINTSIVSVSDVNKDVRKADKPEFNSPIEKDSENIERGGAGSGGYGIGNLSSNFIKSDDEEGSESPNIYYSLQGDKGNDGQALIARVSYTGGSGGQAGAYINTMFKKLPRVTITIGRGGAPSKGGSNGNGEQGKTTKFGTLFTALGGKGGQANAITEKTGTTSAGKQVMLGGDGAASPMEPLSNKAKIIPFGGYSGTNSDLNGMSPLTSQWKSLYYIKSLLGLTYTLTRSIGGSDLEMTYGAGGGGGAGSASGAGHGGAGAPGVVIIEW